MAISANPGTHNNLSHCFLALGVEKRQEPQLEATEEITVHLVSSEQARQIADSGQIIQSLFLAPLYKYLLGLSPSP